MSHLLLLLHPLPLIIPSPLFALCRKELGIDCTGLFEKSELVDRLVTSRMQRAAMNACAEKKKENVEALRRLGDGVSVPLKRLMAREGT